MISVFSGITLFNSWFDSSYAQKNDNMEDDDYDYVFDPGTYFESEEIEEEKKDGSKTLKNQDNLAQEMEGNENHVKHDDVKMINETNLFKVN